MPRPVVEYCNMSLTNNAATTTTKKHGRNQRPQSAITQVNRHKESNSLVTQSLKFEGKVC